MDNGQADRSTLVAAAAKQSRTRWTNMALGITTNHHDAEDAVQEAISKVLTGGGDLPDVDATGRYLTCTVRHCAVDKIRARSRLVAFAEPGESGPRLAPVDADPEARLLRTEDAMAGDQRLRSMLDTLTKPQREAVELLVLGQLKLREASEITGVPLPTLHSRLQAGLNRLRGLRSTDKGDQAGGRYRPALVQPPARRSTAFTRAMNRTGSMSLRM